MRVFKKILCPVDFSGYSRIALRYAIALATENEAPLVICHCVPDLSREIAYLHGDYAETVDHALTSNAKDKLSQFIAEMHPDNLNLLQIIERGSPAERILRVARSTGSDLIIMGTHGHSSHKRFVTGSVTNKVLHGATIPVLTICRPVHHFIQDDASHSVAIKKILCALDYEQASGNIAKLALEIGRMYHAEVTLLHVVPKAYTDEWAAQQEWVRSKLMEFIHPEQDEAFPVKFSICAGHPAEEIMRCAAVEETDLLILGHHSQKSTGNLSIESVARRVVSEATCPALVVRSQWDLHPKEFVFGVC